MGWLAGWDKRIELAINDYAGDIGGAVTWFPATIHLKDANGGSTKVFLEIGNNYRKIAITKVDGETELKGEIEAWNYDAGTPANSTAVIHVSADGWVIDSNTKVYVYYDNDHADNENINITDSPAYRPLVTFVIDDGVPTTYSGMLPLFVAQGEVACSAVVTDGVGDWEMTWAQILELQTAGWEIINHTKTHPHLNELNEAQIRAEFEGSITALEAQGIYANNLVYPFEDPDALTKSLAAEYFRSGRGVTQAVNPQIIDIYNLCSRDADDHTLIVTYKGLVDTAKAGNRWIIFYLHTTDANDEAMLNELIDYIQAQDVDIVTIEQGLNICEIRNKVYNPNYKAVHHMNDQIVNWTTKYEATVEPDSDGWTLVGTDYSSVSSGILTIDTSGNDAYTCNYRQYPDVNFSKGFYLKARIKVDAVMAADDYMQLVIYDGTQGKYFIINLYDGKLGGGVTEVGVTTTDDYHIYELYIKGTVSKIYMDGVLKITETIYTAAVSDTVGFGDFQTSVMAKVYIDYLYYALNVTNNPLLILDSTVNNHDGTKTTVNNPNQVAGQIGLAQEFVGTKTVNSDITITDHADFYAQGDFTIMAVVYCDSFGAAGDTNYSCHVLDKTDGTNKSWFFDVRGEEDATNVGKQSFVYYAPTAKYIYSTNAISLTTWTLIGISFNNTTGVYTFYKNGVADGSASVDITPDNNGSNVFIGGGEPPSIYTRDWDGKICEVQYSTANRSAAWWKGTYNSLFDTLFTYGDEELAGILLEFSETLSIVDTKTTSGTLVKAETLSIADTKVTSGSLGFIETLSIVDSWSALITFFETLSIADSKFLTGTLDLAETLGIADSATFQCIKTFYETLSIIDSKVTSGSLSFAETLSIVDSWSALKVFFETLSIADTVAMGGSLNVSEIISIIDSFIRWIEHPIYTEPAKSSLSFTEPTKTNPVYTKPVKGTTSFTEPAKSNSIYTEPTKGHPVYIEPTKEIKLD